MVYGLYKYYITFDLNSAGFPTHGELLEVLEDHFSCCRWRQSEVEKEQVDASFLSSLRFNTVMFGAPFHLRTTKVLPALEANTET